ncbi:hypothetical protein [Victivallis sp.]|uniref:hypothetical protein n=1 Tax=Victivallis sp. TaxID=2049020 RepID=UPI003A93C99A
MKYFWDGLRDSEIHGSAPDEAVELTEAEFRVLIDAQARGCRIELDADGIPIAVEPAVPPLDELKKRAGATLWSNYKQHQQRYVDAEDLTLATVCAAQGSAKGAAVQQWVMALWSDYYQVRDRIDAAHDIEELGSINLAPDPENVPPYTIRELNEEAAAALAVQQNNQEETP